MQGRWVIAGTPLDEPYPCRCKERPAHARGWKTWRCSPAWCPCAGAPTAGKPRDCCAYRVSPEAHVMAKAAWELEVRRRELEELL